MSNLGLPISEIIKKGKELQKQVSDEPQVKRSRSETYKKAKELEEARKAGDAPALVDEEGRDINPHIPQYISSVPFFYNTNHPTLRHQRSLYQAERQAPPALASASGAPTFQRGVKIQSATKWRPGACDNCGAMDHKRKDCMERPRKLGARVTNKDIAPDVLVPPEERHSYESKRDRWAGYHPDVYKQTIEEYNRVEEAKRRLKETSLKSEAEAACSGRADGQQDNESDSDHDGEAPSTSGAGAGAGPGDCDATNKPQASRETGDVDLDDSLSDDSDDDDEKYAEKAPMAGTHVDSKQRITVRNLRIREDTAKYLLNLDPNSAYYDPKTRSMRENPLPASGAAGARALAAAVDDGFVRCSGDVNNYNRARRFAWEASEKGVDVHLEALPTKTAIIQKEFETKKKEYEERVSKFIDEAYGPNLARPASELQVSQSERYVEFSRTGRVLCGPAKPPTPSQSSTSPSPPPPPPPLRSQSPSGGAPHDSAKSPSACAIAIGPQAHPPPSSSSQPP